MCNTPHCLARRFAASFYPEVTVKQLVSPLLTRIHSELPELGSREVSRNLEGTLTWQLVLLATMLQALPPAQLLPLSAPTQALVDRLAATNSKVGAEAAVEPLVLVLPQA